jgi:hypothetical protein
MVQVQVNHTYAKQNQNRTYDFVPLKYFIGSCIRKHQCLVGEIHVDLMSDVDLLEAQHDIR